MIKYNGRVIKYNIAKIGDNILFAKYNLHFDATININVIQDKFNIF